ncbi:MAG: sigma-70 family RNA polymerase sigma factor [Armatimonadota bacterium]
MSLFDRLQRLGRSLVEDSASDTYDREHYERLVAKDWDRFHRYALHLCSGDSDDAEDLLSETMLDAYRGFHAYRGEGFDRWFFRMLGTNRIDMARRARVRKALSLDAGVRHDYGAREMLEVPDPAPGPERSVDCLLSEPLQAALDALPASHRIPVLLSDVEEKEYEEISRLLDLPLGTVKSRIHRGRARLRILLEAAGWTGG